MGAFRFEHLQPSSDKEKYLVYVGTGNSEITLLNAHHSDDVGAPPTDWPNEDPANPNRLWSWHLVDVTASTTTYLENFNLPNY